MNTHEVLMLAGLRFPDRSAVSDSNGTVTYEFLNQTINKIAVTLKKRGLAEGERVGVWLSKSTWSVAAMHAVMRLGAVFVPLDPLSPRERIATIIGDCRANWVITTAAWAERLGALPYGPALLRIDDLFGAHERHCPAEELAPVKVGADHMAQILYTSGSTGRPKGVCISHGNVMAFVNWAAALVKADGRDRLANHAPFHFDLSVFDLGVAFAGGAHVLLIAEDMAYIPRLLVDFTLKQRPSIWYSVPSVLILMLNHGGLEDNRGRLSLRTLIYAGESFPLSPLRRLRTCLPEARLYNFYGPTETNVCTYYEIGELDEETTRSVPIGKACSGNRVWARKADGSRAAVGETGELVVKGPTTMLGYWGRPRLTEGVYATGDQVLRLDRENFMYLGRLDQMVKVRGYRIEIGEIEAALDQHEKVKEVAVVVCGSGISARITAFTVGDPPPHLLELKGHCAKSLPRYMIIDDLVNLPALPRTANGKYAREKLKSMLLTGTSL